MPPSPTHSPGHAVAPQIAVKLTTPSYLMPTPDEDSAVAASEPLLARHRAAFARHFDAAPAASSTASALGEVREGLRAALLEQRKELHASREYQSWLSKARASKAHAKAPSASSSPLAAAVSEQMASSGIGAGVSPAHALLSEIDGVLRDLDVGRLDK